MIEERLHQKERLLEIQVSERSPDPNTRDDMIQEARITAWSLMRDKPDKPDAYIHAATAQRITELTTRGQLWTGMEGHRGKAIDPLRRDDRDSIDDPEWDVQIEAADALSAVEWAYHHGEIAEALRSLPERHREYVVMRFWGGMTNVEIAARQSVHASNMERTWKQAIRPKLAEQLSHLASAV